MLNLKFYYLNTTHIIIGLFTFTFTFTFIFTFTISILLNFMDVALLLSNYQITYDLTFPLSSVLLGNSFFITNESNPIMTSENN
jgi:hypothetical protein